MLKPFALLPLLLVNLTVFSQIGFDNLFSEPKAIADTLYFPFDDNIQLIIINKFDTWEKQVAFKEATQPRGLSWAALMGPAPQNIYLFRNQAGDIIQYYNTGNLIGLRLKNTDYINTNSFSLYDIQDYSQLKNNLMYYDNNKVGLINIKGDIVIPAIYDNIRNYQDRNEKGDKLVIEKDGMFGLLDENLKLLFPPIYRTSTDTNYISYPEHNNIIDQYIKVLKNDKFGLINENGDILIDFKFDDITLIHDTMFVGLNYSAERNKFNPIWRHVQSCIIYDKNCNQITTLKNYENIEYNGIKRFIVKKNNKVGVIDHKGEIIIPLKYDHLTPQNGDYYVFIGNNSGMINLEGKVVIPIEFEQNMYFYGEAIYVIQGGLIGVYSDKYELIAAPQFKYKTWEMGKYILIRPDGSKGFVQHEQKGSFYQSPEGEIKKL